MLLGEAQRVHNFFVEKNEALQVLKNPVFEVIPFSSAPQAVSETADDSGLFGSSHQQLYTPLLHQIETRTMADV